MSIGLNEVEPWLLSGQPVVRLALRDYGNTTTAYRDELHALAKELKLGIAILELKQVPGLIVQTFLGDDVPALSEPKFSVTRRSMPWLFCDVARCTQRVPFPGMHCAQHAE